MKSPNYEGVAIDPDTPTEMYQLGIRYPDGTDLWGDPVLRAQDAKAGGYYAAEIETLHGHYANRLQDMHAPLPTEWPRFIYRFVTLEYTAPKYLDPNRTDS